MPLIVPGKSLTAKLPDWLGRLRDLLKTALEARKLLPIAFLMLLGFLVLMAWDGYSTTSELLSAQAYVQRTHQVLHEMDGVEDSIQDAREAWLHYILTPEKEDIANFEDAQVRTWTQLDHLLNLDPEHQAAVRKVQDLVRDEFRQLQADLRINYTKLIYHSQQNDEKHERVREAIQQFKDNEERVLRERSEAAQVRSREITRSVSTRIGLFSVFMGVLLLLSQPARRARPTRSARSFMRGIMPPGPCLLNCIFRRRGLGQGRPEGVVHDQLDDEQQAS